jgi:dihydrofolate reductase
VPSLEKAIELCPKNEEAFVIGGGEIYQQSLELVNKIDITRVHTTLEADTFFPAIDTTKWELVFEEFHPKDEKHDYDFTFLTYAKR